MIAYALIYVSCFAGTAKCTTTSLYFDDLLSCQTENSKYVLQGTCLRSHVQLNISMPVKKKAQD